MEYKNKIQETLAEVIKIQNTAGKRVYIEGNFYVEISYNQSWVMVVFVINDFVSDTMLFPFKFFKKDKMSSKNSAVFQEICNGVEAIRRQYATNNHKA